MKLSKNTFIQFLLDNNIDPGKYSVINIKTNGKLYDLELINDSDNNTSSNNNFYIVKHHGLKCDYSTINNNALFIGLLTGTLVLKKSSAFYYYSNGYFLKGNPEEFSEEEIAKLKKMNNYFEADKYTQDYLNESFNKHINDAIYNLLATFSCKPLNSVKSLINKNIDFKRIK